MGKARIIFDGAFDGAPGVPARQDGRDARRSIAPSLHRKPQLLCRRFFIDHNLQVRGHVFMQFDRDNELADGLERLV